MKRILLLLLILVAAGTVSYAQCDKKVIFSSSKTEHIENEAILRTEDEVTVLEFDGSTMELTINGTHRGSFLITSKTCNWSVPFKEGKTIISGSFEEGSYDIVIEGKEGKVTVTAKRTDKVENSIRMMADRFEEVK